MREVDLDLGLSVSSMTKSPPVIEYFFIRAFVEASKSPSQKILECLNIQQEAAAVQVPKLYREN